MATNSGIRPVRVVVLLHPFRADARRAEMLLAPRPQENLLACAERAGMAAADYVFRLNGEIVPAGEEAFHVVTPGAELLCMQAAGGGAWRIVAEVGLMAVTTALTGGFGDVIEAALWTAAGISTAATAGIVAAAISIGGGLLISATLGGASSSTKSASVTYDPNGPKTLAQPGTPIPKGYGNMGWGGNIIASFVDQDGQDEYLNVLVGFGWGTASGMSGILLNGKPISAYPDLTYAMRLGTNEQTPIPGFDQIVNTYAQEIELLAANGPTIAAGQGLDTTGLQIAVKFPGGLMRTDSGGNPKECSLAYKVEISPGGANQWTTPIFPKDTTDVYTTDSNGFRHYPYWVVMPTDRYAGSGIVYSTDTDEGAHTPGETWSMTQSVKVYNVDNTNYTYDAPFQGEWQMTADITLDLQSVTDWWGGWRIVSNMTNQSFYDIVNVYGLAPGKWDARVAKYGAGPHNQPIPQGDGYMTDPHYTADAWLWDVSELQFTDLAYPNMVLLGIRALATSQISGADITVTATIAHGLGADTVLPAPLAGFDVDNPAVVAADMILNPLYGAASTNAAVTIDVPAFVQWAQFCDQPVTNADGTTSRRFVFAGVFDEGGTNLWSSLQKVGSMARAQISAVGNSFTVWVDAPTDITQVFTEANILRGSYSETFLDFDSRSACIEAEFADAARSFRTDLPVSVMTAATINSGQQPKITRTNLLGCTDRDQAWRWAYFHLVSTETLLRTATWKCGVEALSCTIGSVVGMQQRQWAMGGRVQPGSTTTSLLIDRTDLPAFTAEAGWTVGVTHPVVLRGMAVIQAIAALGYDSQSVLTFAGPIPAARFLRCTNNAGTEGVVLGISRTASGGGSTTTIRVQGPGFAVGQTLAFYDYDVVDIQPVAALAGTTVTTQGGFMEAGGFIQQPTPDAPWFYAQTGGTAPYKTFRVTSIRQTGDLQLEVSGLDYNPAIYEDVTPVYGAVFAAPQVVADVSALALVEQLQKTTLGNSKGAAQAYISATWSNGANTAGADVYGQVDGGIWNHMAHVTGTGYSFLATTGDLWTIKIVGFDRLGVAASYADGPEASILVQGTGAAPSDVQGLTGSFVPNGTGGQTVLTWEGDSTKHGLLLPGRPGLSTTVYQGQASFEVRYSENGNLYWNSAVSLATGITTETYTDTTGRTGTYLVKAVSAQGIESLNAASWTSLGSSSSYNAQGSLVPSQAITATYTLSQASDGTWTLTVACPAQSLALSDGTTYMTVASTLTWTGLASTTTYYVYTYIGVADLAMHCASGDPPAALPSSPSAMDALAASSDGCIPGPIFTVTTGSSSSGGTPVGGGGGTSGICPEAAEPVYTRERGIVKAGSVEVGEYLCGWSFVTREHVWRRVRRREACLAQSWHVVEGHRVSPQHPVMTEASLQGDCKWQLPYTIGRWERFSGYRVKLELEEDIYDEQNYWLAPTENGRPLLMHNARIDPC